VVKYFGTLIPYPGWVLHVMPIREQNRIKIEVTLKLTWMLKEFVVKSNKLKMNLKVA
jgi:hypothetical protein